ncbi:hypothetical protein TNCV_2758401 [Trichonephila clavipes]|nr:hypothetical protein TNCV_2758401 [Trichonephila clavipes]
MELNLKTSKCSNTETRNVNYPTIQVLSYSSPDGDSKLLDRKQRLPVSLEFWWQRWDKMLAFRTMFTARVSEGIAIFGSRAAIEFSFGGKERPAHRRSNCSIVLTARVSEGKAIFGSSAAIEFIFEAVPRVNSRLVKLTTLIVKGERFKIGQKDHCSHGRVQNH